MNRPRLPAPPLVAGLLLGRVLQRRSGAPGHLLPSAPFLCRLRRFGPLTQAGGVTPGDLAWRRPAGLAGAGAPGSTPAALERTVERVLTRATRDVVQVDRAPAATAPPAAGVSAAADLSHAVSRPNAGTIGFHGPVASTVSLHPMASAPAFLWTTVRRELVRRETVALRGHRLISPDGVRRAVDRPRMAALSGLATTLRPSEAVHGRPATGPGGVANGPEVRPGAMSLNQVSREAPAPLGRAARPALTHRHPAEAGPAPLGAPEAPGEVSGAERASLPQRLRPAPLPAEVIVEQAVTRVRSALAQDAREAPRPMAPRAERRVAASAPMADPAPDARTAGVLLARLRGLVQEERFRHGLVR